MKDWNKPIIFALGVEKTNDTEHYCHATGSSNCGDNKDNDTTNDPNNHSHSIEPGKTHLWTGLQCTKHQVGQQGNGNGQFACCCAPGCS